MILKSLIRPGFESFNFGFSSKEAHFDLIFRTTICFGTCYLGRYHACSSQKHTQTYVNNLNMAEEKLIWCSNERQFTRDLFTTIGHSINGGVILIIHLWNNLAPPSRQGGVLLSSGPLKEAIIQKFGSFDHFMDIMNAGGLSVQGSGWVWLGYNKKLKQLEITTCANQDPLLSKGLISLTGNWCLGTCLLFTI